MVASVADQAVAQRRHTQIEAELLRRNLRYFVKSAWRLVDPKPFHNNWHLDAICDHLTYVTTGDIRNLIINIPPRQTKSLTVSVLWPVWWWATDPTVQFLFSSYAQDLALRDAQKARDLIQTAWYQSLYGGTYYLDPRENSKARYLTNKKGHRISASVGGKTTGEGGDVVVVDDPHNMQDVHSDPKRNAVLSWWDNSMRSRLNDPRTGRKLLIGQRSHDMDLFGHILATEGDRWVHLCLPMEYKPERHCITFRNPKGEAMTTADHEDVAAEDENHFIFEDPREEEEELLNPGRFGAQEVETEKAAMSEMDYEAQYNQDPMAGGGLILKRPWWRQWVFPPGHALEGRPMDMPPFETLVTVYDTAFKEGEENDFTARTTWGVFPYYPPGAVEPEMHMLLLERYNERVAFPELKTEAKRHERGWKPDYTLIEDKASGQSVVQELRASGIPCYRVPVTTDKVYRANSISPVLRGGRVWYVPRKWAYEVINQCAKFPRGAHDDLVDTCVIAWAFLRRMSTIDLDDDEDDRDEMVLFRKPKKSPYG